MAIAKSTEPVEAPRVFTAPSTGAISGVPTVAWDILRYFNTDISDLSKGSTEEQLKEIEKWTFGDAETLGDGLKKLRDLEIALGSPRHDETRHSRIYNWVKMEKAINDLRARQGAL